MPIIPQPGLAFGQLDAFAHAMSGNETVWLLKKAWNPAA